MALENRRRLAERRQPRGRKALTSQTRALHERYARRPSAAPATLLRDGFR
jgi:hypothetical protein